MGADLLSGIWPGAMRLLCPGLLWLLVGFSPAAAQIPDDIDELVRARGHALLIGVSGYTTGWDQLPSVENDLGDLAAGLAPYFQTVDTVQNPTVAELRTRMHDFLMGHWNRPDERLFVYYSGHGFTDFNQSSRQSDGYITGRDTPLYNQTDGKAVENAVSFFEIDSWSRQTRARHVLMVFDSCFSGSLFQTKAANAAPSRNELDGVRRMLGQPIRYYITAGRQNEQVSADGTFATLLLRGLRGEADFFHEGIISADELGIYLSKEVPRYSQRSQTPQFNSIANARLSEGQFFFLTGPARPEPALPVPAPQPAAAAQGPVKIDLVPTQNGWTKVCGRDPAANKDICYTTRDFSAKTGEPPVLALAIYDIKGDETRIIRLLVPVGLMLRPGFRFAVDKGATLEGSFEICFPNGCFAEAKVKGPMIDELKKGSIMTVAFKNRNNNEVTWKVPVAGFGRAFDGAAIDPKVLEEQQKKLQEELKKRAEGERKRLGAAKQDAAKPATPAPPALATVPPK